MNNYLTFGPKKIQSLSKKKNITNTKLCLIWKKEDTEQWGRGVGESGERLITDKGFDVLWKYYITFLFFFKTSFLSKKRNNNQI